MTKFFEGIKTFQDLKDQYRKLARKLHPDVKTGNADKFKAMKEEYDRLFKTIKDSDGQNFETHSKVSYDFKDIIDKLIFVQNADIEIIGTWIWVWGIKFEDKAQQSQLKELGFKYSKNRKGWYLGQKSQYWKKGMSKDEMRTTFGSEKIGKGARKAIAE